MGRNPPTRYPAKPRDDFVGYNFSVENARSLVSGFSGIRMTAVAAVLVLIGAGFIQINAFEQQKNTSMTFVARTLGDPQSSTAAADATLTDASVSGTGGVGVASSSEQGGLSQFGAAVVDQLVGGYMDMQSHGMYTPEQGTQLATSLASAMTGKISFTPYSYSDVTTDTDTSYERMLTYRSDLQTSVVPLLKNTQPEFEIFGQYVESKDPKYLDALKVVAQNYRDAASASMKVVVPRDAVSYHLGMVNALQEFAAMLDALIQNADDPFASVALLRTYNQAEADVLTSFNALAVYYKQKRS